MVSRGSHGIRSLVWSAIASIQNVNILLTSLRNLLKRFAKSPNPKFCLSFINVSKWCNAYLWEIRNDPVVPMYFQTQLTMMCLGLQSCKFVVWTPDEHKELDVPFDTDYTDGYVQKLKKFYFLHMLPKLADDFAEKKLHLCQKYLDLFRWTAVAALCMAMQDTEIWTLWQPLTPEGVFLFLFKLSAN